MNLQKAQSKQLMELAFRYCLLFHHFKRMKCEEIFVEVYHKIEPTIRFALSDQFILFFKIMDKIGKTGFIAFVFQKCQWIKQLVSKFNPYAIIGNSKSTVNPFNSLGLYHKIRVDRGSIETKTFEIFNEYSIFVFYVIVQSLDINLRLYYLGSF